MKNALIGVFIGCVIAIIGFAFISTFIWFAKVGTLSAITSSPVEEMYHRQLVVTLDSILDARFGSGCYEEVIDSDDITVTHNRFGRVLAPIE